MANEMLVRVSFPLTGLELKATALKVRMAEYTHDVAQISFLGNVNAAWVTGTPVIATWGTTLRAEAFVGYFDHATSDEALTSIVCVGASYPMKEAHQSVWTDTTADQVAYEIADRYQLDPDIVPDGRVFSQITQAGESDWQFLVRLAKSIGYTVYVHQTQLRFHPRTRDFLALQPSAPAFGQNDLYAFRALTGSAVPDGDTLAARQLTVLDNNGEVFTAKDVQGSVPLAAPIGYTPSFTQVSQQVVDNESDAQATLNAQREANRWYITADVVVTGDPFLRQAAPVYLGGLSPDNTGYWFVLSAEHRMVPTSNPQGPLYTAALQLGRDGSGQSSDVPTAPKTQRAVELNPLSGSSVLSTPRLLNGRWVSSHSTAPVAVEPDVPDFVTARLAGL